MSAQYRSAAAITQCLVLTEISQTGLFWSGKQIWCLCSVLFPSFVRPETKLSTAQSWFLDSSITLTVSSVGFLGSEKAATSLHYLLPFSFPAALSLKLESQLPGELASQSVLFGFVCDTQPAAGLSSREPKDFFRTTSCLCETVS